MDSSQRPGPDKASSEPGHRPVVTDSLLRDLQRSAQAIADRYYRVMPAAYFQDIDPETQLSHIKALIAIEASGMAQVMSLRNQEGTVFTFISDQSFPGQLGRFIRQLPDDKPLLSAKVYTAIDSSRVVDVFRFGEDFEEDAGAHESAAAARTLLRGITEQHAELDHATLGQHLHGCNADYLRHTPVDQVLRQFRVAEAVRKTGNAQLDMVAYRDGGLSLIRLAAPHANNRRLFERVTEYLGRQHIDIQRAYLDSFGGEAPVSVLSFLVQYGSGAIDAESTVRRTVSTDLKRLVHLDDEVIALAEILAGSSLLDAEILLALSRLAHQKLVRRNPLLFARERIGATLQRHPELALAIAAAFKRRFDPTPADMPDIAERIINEVESPHEQTVLTTLLAAVGATLRTNLGLADRSALALRLDPAFLDGKGRPEVPHGVFFVTGLDFDGFHVRFRDIARGGVRIVHPRGQEQYALASERHYDECYSLAAAQQLKNKDIPEGGSKGVILARTGADFDHVGLAYADALLDLIVPAPALNALHRDYLQRQELLYLGPDENVSNRLIVNIINRARLRGHPVPDAFMSSKPGAGINHKAYGVTSEGVTVFLDHALQAVGIDPRTQPFTVKMTGGPDGDVAGNEILILWREYGAHARITALADGSGCIEDPDGLDMTELQRLVTNSLPVSEFARDRLGARGTLVTVQDPGGIRHRDGMHNRVSADAFIPAGGRPRTINNGNWRDYLDATGKPSSQVIVEGANLFITPKARKQLSKAGVLIIKDSSANKCGVICSSYEIIASMLLDEDAFLRLKDRYIGQVLEKLRQLAATEAESLFRERGRHSGTDLPTLSVILSKVINRAADALAPAMTELCARHGELTRALVSEHVPAVLLEACGDRLYRDIPEVYLHCIMAARLASRIVYCEGLSWFSDRTDEEIVELAACYLQEDARISQLIASVRQTDLPDKEAIAHLLERGGVAAALKV